VTLTVTLQLMQPVLPSRVSCRPPAGKITCSDGPDASYIALGTMDRNLRIFGSPAGGAKGADDMQEGDEAS